MKQHDEREGLPSASMIDRLFACPGSLRECEGVQEFRDPKLEQWARFGESVHLWLAVGDFIQLTPEEQEIAVQCRDQRSGILSRVFTPSQLAGLIVVGERRFWLEDGNRKRMSGQLDYAAHVDTTGFVCDYKSGRGRYDDAPSNLQLRANAVLFWISTGRKLSSVHVALIQPILGEPTVCAYSADDLAIAEGQLFQILDAAESPDARLVAGHHCKYCPAKIKCPEARRVIETLTTIKPDSISDTTASPMATLLTFCAVADPLIKSIRAHARQMLKNGEVIEGWTLSKPSEARSFEDVPALWARAYQHGLLDQATFISECVSVGVGDLEKAIAKKNNLKPKDAKETINKTFGDLITKKLKEPSLEAK